MRACDGSSGCDTAVAAGGEVSTPGWRSNVTAQASYGESVEVVGDSRQIMEGLGSICL